MEDKSTLRQFKLINKIEGLSFIILLFIAMPLKYMFEYPMATKVAGMAHGILFIAFFILLLQSVQKYQLNKKFGITVFLCSIIPFGSFYSDRLLKEKVNN